MTVTKKVLRNPIAMSTVLLTALLCVCSKAPEYCGDKPLDTNKEFCFGGVTYSKCGGNDYSPDAEFCHAGKTVYAKCDGQDYDPGSQTCNRGVLSGFCGEDAYNPATQFCFTGSVYPRCDTAAYNPTTQFCNAKTVYPKCGGREYDTDTYKCENNTLLTKCGNSFYDTTAQFCANDKVYAKCGGKDYDPASQSCENNTVKAQCGRNYYDPAGFKCDNNILKTKCGNSYFDPATEFCSNGTVRATCGGKEYDPSKQRCDGARLIDIVVVTVAYNANGASGKAPDPVSVDNGTEITLPIKGTLTKDGYNFGGWNTNAAGTGTNYNAGSQYKTAGKNGDTVTLYARWIHIFTVTYNVNGGSGAVQPTTADSGTTIKLPAQTGITREWNNVDGWNTLSNGEGTNYAAESNYRVTGNITLYARWKAEQVATVSYNANGASGTAPASQTAKIGSTITLPSTVSMAKTGYNFGGWNTNSAGSGTNYAGGATYTIAGTTTAGSIITLYAKWLRVFTVSFDANEGDGTVDPKIADSGTTITLPTQEALGRSGYTAGGWSTSAGGGTSYNVGAAYTVTSDATLYAKWTAVTYTLNTSASTGGSVTKDPLGPTYNAGTRVTVTATPNNGYAFKAWSGASTSTDNPLSITMDGNKTLTATFIQAYTLTTNVSPAGGGTVTRNPDAAYFEAGGATVRVTVTAVPNADYVFIGWTGASTAKETSVEISMNGSKTLTAIFGKSFTDDRDGKTYKAVTIGTQTWMAGDMSYTESGGRCYKDSPDSCAKYGGRYTWDEALTVCPAGWHLPSRNEWATLVTFAGGSATKLKTGSGWGSYNGTDDYGFSALRIPINDDNYWWTATEYDAVRAIYRVMYSKGTGVGESNYYYKSEGFSVRCVKDDQ